MLKLPHTGFLLKKWICFFTILSKNVIDALQNEKVHNFKADCVVVQCGLDGLKGDPFRAFLLTEQFYIKFFDQLFSEYPNKPLLILGGGGYNPTECAKCWTSIVASILGQEIQQDIPHHEYLDKYGPTYQIFTERWNFFLINLFILKFLITNYIYSQFCIY